MSLLFSKSHAQLGMHAQDCCGTRHQTSVDRAQLIHISLYPQGLFFFIFLPSHDQQRDFCVLLKRRGEKSISWWLFFGGCFQLHLRWPLRQRNLNSQRRASHTRSCPASKRSSGLRSTRCRHMKMLKEKGLTLTTVHFVMFEKGIILNGLLKTSSL